MKPQHQRVPAKPMRSPRVSFCKVVGWYCGLHYGHMVNQCPDCPAETARATVTVRALDRDTGKPIEGVVVNIKKASAITNKSGRARLSVEVLDTHEENQIVRGNGWRRSSLG